MKASKSQINKISKYLWKQGHGSKRVLSDEADCKQTEISRMLRGGNISEAKLSKILEIVEAKC